MLPEPGCTSEIEINGLSIVEDETYPKISGVWMRKRSQILDKEHMRRITEASVRMVK
jgi:hypothetical protein